MHSSPGVLRAISSSRLFSLTPSDVVCRMRRSSSVPHSPFFFLTLLFISRISACLFKQEDSSGAVRRISAFLEDNGHGGGGTADKEGCAVRDGLSRPPPPAVQIAE